MPFFAHIGTGFFAKPYAPKVPVWTLVALALLPDILSIFLHSALWITHGLIMGVVWAVVATLIAWIITQKKQQAQQLTAKEAQRILMIAFLLTFGHWVFDFIGWPMTAISPQYSGIPFFFADTPASGIGVYKTLAGAIIMDFGCLAIGIWRWLKYKKSINHSK